MRQNQYKDTFLEMLFGPDRWLSAISKGVDKDIRKDQLIALTSPSTRAALYAAIRDDSYTIAPPHAALIPKDKPGEWRRVFVNEPVDRVLLSIINDLLFETCPEMIHPCCKSYQKGIGCGKIVQELSRVAMREKDDVVGWKADLSKYFDTVPMRYIDAVFDEVEQRVGKSAVIRLLRAYYHSDLYFDENGNLIECYQSLKQGCAVSAFLADAALRHVDVSLARLKGFYVRYSDDTIFLGADQAKAMETLKNELGKMEMRLNPAKVETVSKDRWYKFLGFSIKGADISLSARRIKTFQKAIEDRTIHAAEGTTQREALNNVNRFLYKGESGHSWASQALSVVNVQEDINTLDRFVKDCLRAVQTGKEDVGGLGFNPCLKRGCIARGTGKNVRANLQKTPAIIKGYKSMNAMRSALLTNKEVYLTLTQQL